MKYFVSSDVHGFFDEWMTALNNSGFDINNKNHKIIVCGDLFDRGRQPKQIIDFVLAHKDKIILIRGNHEDLMEQMIERNKNNYADLHNGTAQTIVDLYPEWMISEFDLKKIAKETRIQEVIDLSVDYFETKKYIFVHGWIPVKEGLYPNNKKNSYERRYFYLKNWRNAGKQLWIDARWQNPVEMYKNKIYEPNKTIVCGHWHCSALWHEIDKKNYTEFGKKANFNPFITKDMIALDACTVYSKKVNVVVVDDVPLKQKDENFESEDALVL